VAGSLGIAGLVSYTEGHIARRGRRVWPGMREEAVQGESGREPSGPDDVTKPPAGDQTGGRGTGGTGTTLAVGCVALFILLTAVLILIAEQWH
jgi:hypothetical protein